MQGGNENWKCSNGPNSYRKACSKSAIAISNGKSTTAIAPSPLLAWGLPFSPVLFLFSSEYWIHSPDSPVPLFLDAISGCFLPYFLTMCLGKQSANDQRCTFCNMHFPRTAQTIMLFTNGIFSSSFVFCFFVSGYLSYLICIA